MGCDGCELHPTAAKVRETLRMAVSRYTKLSAEMEALIIKLTADGPQAVMLNRNAISHQLAEHAGTPLLLKPMAKEIEKAIASLFICYAGSLHRFVNRNGKSHGWAYPFEKPLVMPGRVARLALMAPPSPDENAEKPWLFGAPRMVFLSDMGDALSKDISFDTLLDEIIKPVSSELGRRHLWLWLTKRPSRMADFAAYIEKKGYTWPDQLVAMTSITSAATVNRVHELRKVPAKHRGLSVEPLWEQVTLPLEGISWVIVGGQSGSNARPFHVEWAESIADQCDEAGSAYFLKQLGSEPHKEGQKLELADNHGGNWDEWPSHLRRREIPSTWKNVEKKMEPTPCAKPLAIQTRVAMITSKQPSPEFDLGGLEMAEKIVGAATKRYTATVEEQRDALLELCDGMGALKSEFETLPKQIRPEPTWQKYVASCAPKLGLTFRTARQADLYIALGKDYKAMPKDAQDECLNNCSTYREMRAAIDNWRASRAGEKPKPSPYDKLLDRACGIISRAAKVAPEEHKVRLKQCHSLLIALTAESPKKVEQTYKPDSVRALAADLGGQTALGRSVGKQNGHASYWVRSNRIPQWTVPLLTDIYHSKGVSIDLSSIAATQQ